MQTSFTPRQLAEPRIAEANQILRSCVHCGFCTATCPTYVLLGDELDSPRGRIYLIKEMLEEGRPAGPEEVKHIDRCLSCLACMTTCPSGVHYMHLIDEARAHVEATFERPFMDRLFRRILARVVPDARLFRLALSFARLGRPLAPLVRTIPGLRPAAAMLELAPRTVHRAASAARRGVHAAPGEKKGRVALLAGCVQDVLEPTINQATISVLNRLGYDVVLPSGMGCCGSATHHLGLEADARARARRNVDAWTAEIDGDGLDAIIINASGCGTTVKDYGHMLRFDAGYQEKAERVAGLARDITEFIDGRLPATIAAPRRLKVAYHSACSMQHGQKITRQPKALLTAAGLDVVDIPEGHLCCGSAGTYNMLQPDIAGRLKARKLANIAAARPDVVATGNIGCITQLGRDAGVPVVHTIELIEWALGGPEPSAMRNRA
jgi:glycolate oxidase iron-sulfur subunit